jgi:tetratricopeptide (TPR) repeat protein
VGKAARLLASNLLDQLRVAPDETAAGELERQIWAAWMKSGDAEIDDLVQRALLLMEIGRLDEALAILDSVVAKAPDYAEGWNKRATLLYVMSEYDRSLKDIDCVLSLEPRHFGAISGIGLIRAAKGDFQGAIDAYRRVLAIDPHNGSAQKSIDALQKHIDGSPI